MSEEQDSNSTSLFSNIIEAGECRVQKGYRVVLRDICENNYIKEGDIIIIYVKKKKID